MQRSCIDLYFSRFSYRTRWLDDGGFAIVLNDEIEIWEDRLRVLRRWSRARVYTQHPFGQPIDLATCETALDRLGAMHAALVRRIEERLAKCLAAPGSLQASCGNISAVG